MGAGNSEDPREARLVYSQVPGHRSIERTMSRARMWHSTAACALIGRPLVVPGALSGVQFSGAGIESYHTPGERSERVTDLQLYIAIGLPTVAVLTSLVISLAQISAIREDVREIRGDIRLLTGKVYELMGQK